MDLPASVSCWLHYSVKMDNVAEIIPNSARAGQWAPASTSIQRVNYSRYCINDEEKENIYMMFTLIAKYLRFNPNQICIVPFGTLFLRTVFKH